MRMHLIQVIFPPLPQEDSGSVFVKFIFYEVRKLILESWNIDVS